MKKSKLKTLIALLMALLMALSMTACGSDTPADEPVSADVTPEPQPAAEPTPEPVVTPDVAPDDLTSTFTSNDGLVTEFAVMQVMGKGLNTDDGSFFDLAQYVAGKEASIYIAFNEAVEAEADGSMLLTITRDGEQIAQLLPRNQGVTEAVEFVPKNMSDVGSWAAGDYTFTFQYGDSVAERSVKFLTSKSIKVLAVPVLANYGGNIVGCEGEWKTAIQFTKDTYPIADNGIEYVLGSELDLSSSEYDLTSDEGMYNVWYALTTLQTPNNDYELILGFVRDRQGDGSLQGYTYGKPANIITESDGDMQPTVAHEIAHCYNIGDEYPGGAINNATNPAPYGMEGSDWNNRDLTVAGNKAAVKSANDFGNGNTGSIVFPEQIPYNSRTKEYLANVGSFMGSGSADINDYWTTSDIWMHLFKAFVFNDASFVADESGAGSDASSADASGDPDSSMFTCPGCYQSYAAQDFYYYIYCESCGSLTAVDPNTMTGEPVECEYCGEAVEVTQHSVYLACPDANCEGLDSLANIIQNSQAAKMTGKVSAADITEGEASTVRAIDITGTMYSSGTFKERPWYTYDTDSTNIKRSVNGAYSVIMQDKDGKVLSTQKFDVSFYTQSNPPTKKEFAPVSATLLFHPNTARIIIMSGDKEVYSTDVTETVPSVEFLGIKENQSFSGKQTIKWSAVDPDSDTLFYELWYMTEEGDAYNIASDIRTTSYDVDFDTLPGSDAAYLYIYATDGVNTGENSSEWITVEYKAPELISKQDKVPEYKLTDEILFDADIYDMQDGWLYDSSNVSWTLDGREFITGSLLWVYPYELTPGEHKFTVTGTNSKGKSVSGDFTFKVLDDESALPNDWSREDIKNALANGFIAPLANVNSAITRGQFASLMNTMYWTMWEEGSPEPEYVEGIVTDCGQDDYSQFLMVNLGVMDAPNGKFNPNGQLTEEEAAYIMFNLCAIADPNICEQTDDREGIALGLIEAGVADESGDNLYTSDKPITGRLALVRCNRLYTYMFD